MVERWAILFSGEFLWIFCSTVIVACVCVCFNLFQSFELYLCLLF